MRSRQQRILASPYYRNNQFQNLHPTAMLQANSMVSTLRRQLFGKEQRRPSKPLPSAWPGQSFHQTPPASGLRVTWLGHSTLLIEFAGITILTDPVWAKHLSPVQGIGPQRFQTAPIALEQLPTIDLVLLSHDHYDHLDKQTIRWLARGSMPFVTALGVGDHLERWGITSSRIHELDWWEELHLAEFGLTIAAVPAQHFSGRGLKRNSTLWASWVVMSQNSRIYVGCDSGMFAGFQDIGQRYGPFELATLEMAQYDVAWPGVHMQPEEALQAAEMLQARTMLPVHWGAYCLSLHAWDEPIERLLKAAQTSSITILTPQLGQPVEPSHPKDLTEWWRG
ncbi:MBL fold metallo-hydrolase [Herpetosiphon gulosus]|uniref:Uncharacterized protein Rv0906 n=1 Tax=Herpetosiphon gulosus TaxID=1973496 RepID=A0ABP9X662_9CHLR